MASEREHRWERTGLDQPVIGGRGRGLSLDEVRACGLPAIFLDYGEVLLYRDNQLFDLRRLNGQPEASPFPLPARVLESGLGIEYGWHHVGGCTCRLCRASDEQQRVSSQAA